MRRGRIFFYLAFIIILGLVAFWVIWQRFLQPTARQTNTPQPTAVVNTINVIVVTQRIPRGTAVTGSVLGLVPIQQELFYEGMFTDIAQVEGRLAKFDLEAGIPLTKGMLVDSADQLSGTGSVAALSIPRGMVAVSIPISRLSSVSYAPQPGDHVNVIVTMLLVDLDSDFQTLLPNRSSSVIAPGTGDATLNGATSTKSDTGPTTGSGDSTAGINIVGTTSLAAVTGGGGGSIGKAVQDDQLGQTFYEVPGEKDQRPRMVSQNLLQDAIVLQIGNFAYKGQPEPTPTPAPGEGQAQTQGEAQAAPTAPPPPDVITLVVAPQDAITLNYLLYSGAQLTLALRAAQDDTRIQTESVTLQFLLEQYNITVPAKLPNGMEPPVKSLEQPALSNDVNPTPAP
jgi:pilus assembly protein CpaB